MEFSEHGFRYEWDPKKFAIAYERFAHPSDDGRGSLVVRHSTAPFRAILDEGTKLSDTLCQWVGYRYLRCLAENLKRYEYCRKGLDLPAGWLDSLDPDAPGKFFGWLPIVPPFGEGVGGPTIDSRISSLRLVRRGQDGEHDTSVILAAAELLPDGDRGRPINSAFGLEVVIHVVPDDGRTSLHVTAMTVHYPYGGYVKAVSQVAGMLDWSTVDDEAPRALSELPDTSSDMSFIALIEAFLRHPEASIEASIAAVSQLRTPLSGLQVRFFSSDENGVVPRTAIDVSGIGLDALVESDMPLTYGFTTRVWLVADGSRGGLALRFEQLAKVALVAKAATQVEARYFEQDPASWRDLDKLPDAPPPYRWSERRPTREDTELDRFRRLVDLGDENPVPLETCDFIVRNCPNFVPTDPKHARLKKVHRPPAATTEDWPAVRSNDLSAIAAFVNCGDLFAMMRSFGLDDREQYFRMTRGRLQVFYRSGVWPGPGVDGLTVNARVTLELGDHGDDEDDGAGDARPRLALHLALAELTRWDRPVPPDGAPTWAEPLGIANSERWMWHEFGHALIAGRLGVLELQFAHSVGDALAAIGADPCSRLADPRGDLPAGLRGITYPWVYLTRRHDRCVLNGWSWNGTFQRPVIEAPEIDREARKGYLSEQILSTTLFRLYLVLGGDTDEAGGDGPDYDVRKTASLVSVFFIMRGLETFALSPVRAEELEAALIDADLGLTTPLALELRPGLCHAWRGGQAHKVIRWAFEAQGMHWPRPDVVHDAPGKPPPVDIYIEDRRPREEATDSRVVTYGPGGYVPVSLAWVEGAAWQASADAVSVSSDDISVVVRNRGQHCAEHVSVRAWLGWVEPTTAGAAPHRDRDAIIHWHAPFSVGPDDGTVPEGGETRFSTGPQSQLTTAEPSAPMLLLLFEATCPDDRGNSDPAAHLPCAVPSEPPRQPRALIDLVANDNNLALHIIGLG